MTRDKEPYKPVWSHSCQYCGAEFVTAGAKNAHERICSNNPNREK